MDLHLTGKLAVITGGSRGIGRSIALRLAEEGCNVAICGRTQEPLAATIAALRAYGVSATGTLADVTRPGDVERFVAEAATVLGGVDLLVANAGGSFGGDLPATTSEDWERTFELNLFHAVRAVRSAIPPMRARQGGSVLLVASISGWQPVQHRSQYAAAKAAQIHLARSLAQELAPDRIRVNALSPGSVLFDGGGWSNFRSRHPQEYSRFEAEQLPWQRLGKPEEIADVAAFLLSDRASWINGANIPVDGAQRSPAAW
jgi:3-oxoacyl-[acyl-carrier protein] reductase